MSDTKRWEKSSVTLIGDPTKKRNTFNKIVAMGLLGVVLAKAGTMAFDAASSNNQLAHEPLAFSQLHSLENKEGQRLTEVFGSKHTVFVYTDDASLKEIINSLDSKHLEGIDIVAPSSKLRSATENVLDTRLGVKQDHEQILRQNAYDNLTQTTEAGFISMARPDAGSISPDQVADGVMFINTKTDSSLAVEKPRNFPEVNTQAEEDISSLIRGVSLGINSEHKRLKICLCTIRRC